MTAIIDYRAGNLTSVALAFETLAAPAEITADPERIMAADRVVFPGVGAAGSALRSLRESGLADVIGAVVRKGTPFLGICLGTQILFEHLDEDGGVDGLALLQGGVHRFDPQSPYDKVPQMGWNSVHIIRNHPLFDGIRDGSEFYFVHSYYVKPHEPDVVIGETEYAGVGFASAVARGSMAATQFHPEKSGRIGLRLLRNFVEWQPGREAL